MSQRRRAPTSTSNFGVGVRESHDSSGFYERFRPPVLSEDDTVLPPQPVQYPFQCGDARRMDGVADGSVALVVTSPPYFAGKQYEEELEREGVPSSYLEYLQMLTDVFAECVRKLEPGGRIAVNVANLGRKPYRSLSADVIGILADVLGLLLRGELIWQKGEGATGSCAWGSFRGASNPVLRDLTERVIVASKGRFNRARTPKQRVAEGLPHESTLMSDDFMSLTLDVWPIPPESAKRVGHPAPFPVELPEQLIRLYTFRNDLVLDPFMGSGSALVAAARLDRRYVGYDLDPAYVDIARQRVNASIAQPELYRNEVADRAAAQGLTAHRYAEQVLADSGFAVIAHHRRLPGAGISIDLVATDATGNTWHFDVAGAFTSRRGGMHRMETVWRALGRAATARRSIGDAPLVILSTALPSRCSDGDAAMRSAGPATLFDAIDLLAADAVDRLKRYAKGAMTTTPLPGFWTEDDLQRFRPRSLG